MHFCFEAHFVLVTSCRFFWIEWKQIFTNRFFSPSSIEFFAEAKWNGNLYPTQIKLSDGIATIYLRYPVRTPIRKCAWTNYFLSRKFYVSPDWIDTFFRPTIILLFSTICNFFLELSNQLPIKLFFFITHQNGVQFKQKKNVWLAKPNHLLYHFCELWNGMFG